MSVLADSQHEAFAQARFAGKPLLEAHYAAGYAGDNSAASKLNRLPEIRERIAELYREAATQTAYEKTHAVRDLLAIIHTPPSDSSEDHPLCEVRMGKNGPYYRFPPKLQAMARLIKLMGWSEPVKVEVELKDNFTSLLAEIRSGRTPQPSAAFRKSSTTSHPESDVARDSDVETEGRAPGHPGADVARDSDVETEGHAPGHPGAESHNAAISAPAPSGPNGPFGSPSDKGIAPDPDKMHSGGYQKDGAIRDLVTIILAPPSEASPDHPLCEMRMSAWGPYHRFPSKLSALTLLTRMLGWECSTPPKEDHDPDAGFKILREALRHRS